MALVFARIPDHLFKPGRVIMLGNLFRQTFGGLEPHITEQPLATGAWT
jgi:hypothetical protein